MIPDIVYSMSSFLMFRSVLDSGYCFTNREDFSLNTSFIETLPTKRTPVRNVDDLYKHLSQEINSSTDDGKAALMLSGGIDSGVLAGLMPKNSQTYTLKCIVPGKNVYDETPRAKLLAQKNSLKNSVVEIYWEDFEKYSPLLMKHKGAPIHSIEVQIYKAALKAKEEGYTKLIFGEHADIIYGGLDSLLSKDWLVGDFIERYSFVLPYKVLRNFKIITDPFARYEKNGYIDVYAFINGVLRLEAWGSYINACQLAGIDFIAPYATSYLATPLNLSRVRSGDSKYLIRQLYKRLYGDQLILPAKKPLPRPMSEWLETWGGPSRPEFWPNCTDALSGDQKWMVYCLELFLNLINEDRCKF